MKGIDKLKRIEMIGIERSSLGVSCSSVDPRSTVFYTVTVDNSLLTSLLFVSGWG